MFSIHLLSCTTFNKCLESNTCTKHTYLCNHMQSLVASWAHGDATCVCRSRCPRLRMQEDMEMDFSFWKVLLLACQCTTCPRNSPLHQTVRFLFCIPSTLSTSKRRCQQALTLVARLTVSYWQAAGLQGRGPALKPLPSHCLMWYIQILPNGANSSSNSNTKLTYLLKKVKETRSRKKETPTHHQGFLLQGQLSLRATCWFFQSNIARDWLKTSCNFMDSHLYKDVTWGKTELSKFLFSC